MEGPGEYIGRPSPLGNPIYLADPNNNDERGKCIAGYAGWLADKINHGDTKILAELDRLTSIAIRGDLNIICWCAPKACHGDIIKMLIEKQIRDIVDHGEMIDRVMGGDNV